MSAGSGSGQPKYSSAHSSDSRKANKSSKVPSTTFSNWESESSPPLYEPIAKAASDGTGSPSNPLSRWLDTGTPYGRAEDPSTADSEFSRVAGTIPAFRLPDGGQGFNTASSRAGSPAISLPASTPTELKDPDRPLPKAFNDYFQVAGNTSELQNEPTSASVYPNFPGPPFPRPAGETRAWSGKWAADNLWSGDLRKDFVRSNLSVECIRKGKLLRPGADHEANRKFEHILREANTDSWVYSDSAAPGRIAFDRLVVSGTAQQRPNLSTLAQQLKQVEIAYYRKSSGSPASFSSSNDYTSNLPPAMKKLPHHKSSGEDENRTKTAKSKSGSKKSSTESLLAVEYGGIMEPTRSPASSYQGILPPRLHEPNYYGVALTSAMKSAAAEETKSSKSLKAKEPAAKASTSKPSAIKSDKSHNSQKPSRAGKKATTPSSIADGGSSGRRGRRSAAPLSPSSPSNPAPPQAALNSVYSFDADFAKRKDASKALKGVRDKDEQKKKKAPGSGPPGRRDGRP